MVTSIAGLVVFGGLPGVVGLGLGIAALKRIGKSGKRGRGMAIAGIVVGSVGILYAIFLAFVIVSAITSANWDDTYSYSSGQGESDSSDGVMPDYTLRTDLQVGDCLDYYPDEWDMSDAAVVDCSVPHEGEVVALITMAGPGSTDLNAYDPAWEEASGACTEQSEELMRDRTADGEAVLWAPHPDDFASGGTTAYCTFFTYEEPLVGSAVEHTLAAAPGSST